MPLVGVAEQFFFFFFVRDCDCEWVGWGGEDDWFVVRLVSI